MTRTQLINQWNKELKEIMAKAIEKIEGCYDGCPHCKQAAKAAFKSIQEFIIERQLETTDILEILK